MLEKYTLLPGLFFGQHISKMESGRMFQICWMSCLTARKSPPEKADEREREKILPKKGVGKRATSSSAFLSPFSLSFSFVRPPMPINNSRWGRASKGSGRKDGREKLGQKYFSTPSSPLSVLPHGKKEKGSSPPFASRPPAAPAYACGVKEKKRGW